MCSSDAASAAPVEPALTSASARPSATALRGLHDRRVGLRAHRPRRLLVVGDRDRRVDELDRRRTLVAECRLDLVRRAEQDAARARRARRCGRPPPPPPRRGRRRACLLRLLRLILLGTGERPASPPGACRSSRIRGRRGAAGAASGTGGRGCRSAPRSCAARAACRAGRWSVFALGRPWLEGCDAIDGCFERRRLYSSFSSPSFAQRGSPPCSCRCSPGSIALRSTPQTGQRPRQSSRQSSRGGSASSSASRTQPASSSSPSSK